MKRHSLFKGLLGGTLAGVMVLSTAFGTAGPTTVKADGNLTDPILVASFWNSDNDTSDTIYFSTDGWNFHEICEAFTDGDRNNPDYNKVTKLHHSYVYADPGVGVGYSGSATLTGFATDPQVLKLDSNGNYIYHATDPLNDETLHDPCIFYYDPEGNGDGYFWMVSGYKTGVGDARRVVIMLSYSKDLINWSFPSSGSATNIKLTELPTVNNERAQYYDSTQWDMVAPDITICDGKIYVCFSIGYFALHHPEDTRENKSIYDEMYPYMAEITGITMPKYADTSNPSVAYTPDPAKMPEASLNMKVTYSDAKPVKLPCMTSGSKYYRPEGAHNHIDASIYEEGGYFYYSIKENGVTNEIWRTRSLANVSDPNSWELVSYDVITGYEGPCLIKYGGEYFMYVDRLSGFKPTRLDGEEDPAFTSEGVHVVKASIGTTGKLDGQTGWLESNIKEIKTYKLGSTTETKTTRHGTVYVATGEAAKRVRLAAKSVGYSDSALYGGVNASDWASEGWYHKESYLNPRVFGQNETQFHKFYYVNNARIGSSATTDLGIVKTLDDNPYFFQADASDPDRDGMMFCGYSYDGYKRGEPSVSLPADWDYYNLVGRDAYGTANYAWKTYFYEWNGLLRKEGHYLNGDTWNWYYVDPKDGHMTKGAFWLVNDEGYDCIIWFDMTTGIRQDSTSFVANNVTYYTNNGGFAYYDEGLTRPVEKGVLPSVSYPTPMHMAGKNLEWTTGTNEKNYWYENGERQGTVDDPKGVYGDGTNRGREICDMSLTDDTGQQGVWFWLDSVYGGAKAVGKEVWVPYIYQNEKEWDDSRMREVANESDPGMGTLVYDYMKEGKGKWVRYDNEGRMLKGWVTIEGDLAKTYPNQAGNRYYYDSRTGLMAKGWITLGVDSYYFDTETGVLTRNCDREIDGVVYHFDENGKVQFY